MRIALAIFAKTLGLSSVKTRLAASIGKENAEAFYRLSIDCVRDMALSAAEQFDGELLPCWTLAEEEGPLKFSDQSFSKRWTGEGGLGTRLANVSEALFDNHDGVILIGTDSPQLDARHVLDAIDLMCHNKNRCVAGPAIDGGFYLFGSLTPVRRAVWETVTYSCETTLKELSELLERENRPIVRLEAEQDVDVREDLATLENGLSGRRDTLSTSQRHLLDWLSDHRHLFR